MNIKHIIQQPFVAATGAAALLHSTWALGTLFAGEQPEGWHVIGWLLPALLIAFALDVGQISTSNEIREFGLTWTRGITFVVFAGATYYLQWLYMAHHMPALELAPGVRATWAGFATVMRDAAVWVIPALLPLSTLLYTFSGGRVHRQLMSVEPDLSAIRQSSAVELLEGSPIVTEHNPAHVTKDPPESDEMSSKFGEIEAIDGQYLASFGDWQKTYPTQASAQRGLSGYISRYRFQQRKLLNGHGEAVS